jgi:hypothetical protein
MMAKSQISERLRIIEIFPLAMIVLHQIGPFLDILQVIDSLLSVVAVCLEKLSNIATFVSSRIFGR